jgi:hypothetical protein
VALANVARVLFGYALTTRNNKGNRLHDPDRLRIPFDLPQSRQRGYHSFQLDNALLLAALCLATAEPSTALAFLSMSPRQTVFSAFVR